MALRAIEKGSRSLISRRGLWYVVSGAAMDILLVASEIAPWVQRSSVAEAVASFSKTLKQVGHAVTVVVPHCAEYERAGLLLARRLSNLKLADSSELTVYDTQLTSGVRLVIVDLAWEAQSEPGLGTAVRFAQAIASLVNDRSSLGVHTDIVHIHDLLGSLVALAIAQLGGPRPPVVLTLYDDIRGPSSTNATEDSQLGAFAGMPQLMLNGQISLLAAAVRSAHSVTTPSHVQARRLGDTTYSGPIADDFKSLTPAVSGIPCGVDYSRANPSIDPQLPARFDAEDCSPKGSCKSALQRQLALEIDVQSPLLFVPGPLIVRQGGNILADVLTKLLDYSLSVVVALRDGDDEDVARSIIALAQQWPKRIATLPVASDHANTAALGAADFVLLTDPESVLESYHLYALRYGCAPIASLSGVHADHLVDCDAKLQTGNCFAFETWTPEQVLGAVSRAVTAWGHPELDRLRRRIMHQDLGWERPTRRMVQVYRQALGIKV